MDEAKPQPVPLPSPGAGLSIHHQRRLREVWRSAGWPFQDLIEIELLAAGFLSRERDGHGRETVRVTDAGIAQLAQTLQRMVGALEEVDPRAAERVRCALRWLARLEAATAPATTGA